MMRTTARGALQSTYPVEISKTAGHINPTKYEHQAIQTEKRPKRKQYWETWYYVALNTEWIQSILLCYHIPSNFLLFSSLCEAVPSKIGWGYGKRKGKGWYAPAAVGPHNGASGSETPRNVAPFDSVEKWLHNNIQQINKTPGKLHATGTSATAFWNAEQNPTGLAFGLGSWRSHEVI